MTCKRTLRVLLSGALCAALLIGALPAEALAEPAAPQAPQSAQLSQDYLDYLENPQDYAGRMPTPVELEGAADSGMEQRGAGLPEAVDLRRQGLVPETVYAQGAEETCWAVAMTTAAEITARGQALSTVDFSYTHMKYATSADGGNTWGHDRSYVGAGNEFMSTAYLLRGSGLVSEEEDPETIQAGIRPVAVTDQKALSYNAWSVRWFSDMPKTATEQEQADFRAQRMREMKQALAEGNAVTCELYYSSRYEYTVGDRVSYYSLPVGSSVRANHEIVLVGYDDAYSKDNFDPAAGVTMDGAFLVRNSWGANNAMGGYFYLSYQDAYAAGGTAAIYLLDELGTYDATYQYDPLGMTKYLFYTSEPTVRFANLFSLESSGEILSSVSFASVNASASYRVLLAKDLSADTVALTDVAFTEIAGGSLDSAGYYTVQVPDTVLTGDKYAIQIVLSATDGQKANIPIEAPVAGFSSQNAKAQTGQSFVTYGDFAFADLTSYAAYANSNVCIKAHTQSAYQGDLALDLESSLAYDVQPRTDAAALKVALAGKLAQSGGLGRIYSVALMVGEQPASEGFAATGMTAQVGTAAGQLPLKLCVLGDVAMSSKTNCGDGAVTAADALQALKLAIKAAPAEPAVWRAANVTRSGEVTALDALRILQFSIGAIDAF